MCNLLTLTFGSFRMYALCRIRQCPLPKNFLLQFIGQRETRGVINRTVTEGEETESNFHATIIVLIDKIDKNWLCMVTSLSRIPFLILSFIVFRTMVIHSFIHLNQIHKSFFFCAAQIVHYYFRLPFYFFI